MAVAESVLGAQLVAFKRTQNRTEKRTISPAFHANDVITITAVGVERSRDRDGEVILLLANGSTAASAYRLSANVASDLHNLLGMARALSAERRVANGGRIEALAREPAEMLSPGTGVEASVQSRLSPRACIGIIAAASMLAWAVLAYGVALLL